MTTMNISLPESMKDWVEQQARSGRYNNTSDYVRDLIRQDQDRDDRLRRMQALITEGLESGISDASMDDIRRRARECMNAD
ncbi:MAG: type II toxin-antitoxin system ParD family antitoxin [Pseudohongiellaceae bacterium]